MASTEADFWGQRREISPSGDTQEPLDGHRLGLITKITNPDIRAAGEDLCNELDKFGCFEPSPVDAFHLTVKLFEIQVSPSVSAVSNSSNAVRRIGETVSDLATAFDPFDVQFPQINLFPDVVYGEVDDQGQLAELNDRLCQSDLVDALERDRDGFIPHLTFGYFVNDSGFRSLVDFLEANRQLRFPAGTIDELSLVAYEMGGRPPTYNRLDTYPL